MRLHSRSIIAALAAALCLIMAADLAQAQSTSRVYLATYLGLNLTHGQNFNESTLPAEGSINYKNTASFAGALGLRLNRNIRVEGELSYRNAKLNSASFGGGTRAIGGHDKTYLALANVYYDFSLNWKNIVPFITAGVGVASHNMAADDPSGALPTLGGHSLGFAYQAGAGLLYRVSPGLAFTGDYRFLGTSTADVDSYKVGYHSHEIRLGLQYDLPVGFLD